MPTNFQKETLNALKENGKTWEDVRFVQNEKFSVQDLDVFFKSMDFCYDSDYGGDVIEPKLVIVGDDWWLERHEYDGASWWEFKKIPIEICRENVKMVKTKEYTTTVFLLK